MPVCAARLPSVVAAAALLSLGSLAGCAKPCQSLCQTMATRAADCGLTVTEQDLEDCAAKYEEVDEQTEAACAEADDANRLEEWWTCDELAANYSNGAK
jgi:hypothetical protein